MAASDLDDVAQVRRSANRDERSDGWPAIGSHSFANEADQSANFDNAIARFVSFWLRRDTWIARRNVWVGKRSIRIENSSVWIEK